MLLSFVSMFRCQIWFYLFILTPSNHSSTLIQPSQAYPQTFTILADVASLTLDCAPKLMTFTSIVSTPSALILTLNCHVYA